MLRTVSDANWLWCSIWLQGLSPSPFAIRVWGKETSSFSIQDTVPGNMRLKGRFRCLDAYQFWAQYSWYYACCGRFVLSSWAPKRNRRTICGARKMTYINVFPNPELEDTERNGKLFPVTVLAPGSGEDKTVATIVVNSWMQSCNNDLFKEAEQKVKKLPSTFLRY